MSISPLLNNSIFDIKCDELCGKSFYARVVDIYDGDTLDVVLDNLQRIKIRLNGIDTPEIKPLKSVQNRDDVIHNAILARNFLLQCVTDDNCHGMIHDKLKKCDIVNILKTNNEIIKVDIVDKEKYGRYLCNIYGSDGKVINNLLITNGYAVEYFG